jgi:hypothetical protein
MTWSELLQAGWKGLIALVAAGGGGAAIAFGIFKATGQQWLEQRFKKDIERLKHEQNKEIEATKAELASSIEREKAVMAAVHEEYKNELQELSTQRLDALNRKRDVYARLATKLRIFLKANTPAAQVQNVQVAFLEAYDEGYLWASEPVVAAVRDFIDAIEKKTAADKSLLLMPPNAPIYGELSATVQALDVPARDLYQRCLLEKRRDSGFPSSAAEYRVVSFRQS